MKYEKRVKNKENKGKYKKENSFRIAVFIVVYQKINGTIKYILLKRKKHWTGWEFPKGGIEKNENILKAVKRECFEETGLKPTNVKNFNIKGRYFYNKNLEDRKGFIGQTYQLFSAEVFPSIKNKIRIDRKEHSGFRWLDFKKAIKLLKWKNQKMCLNFVNRTLTGNSK